MTDEIHRASLLHLLEESESESAEQVWQRWIEPYLPKTPPAPDIEAKITFLRTEEGGRKYPIQSGYRGQFCYDGDDWGVRLAFETDEPVSPGDTVTAHLSFLRPEAQRGRLHPGKRFALRDGAQVIARGYVRTLLALEA